MAALFKMECISYFTSIKLSPLEISLKYHWNHLVFFPRLALHSQATIFT
ncbi:unnamed protein product [Cuscuta europaea]|uniref:Uncharacterized protein n=1 Tax=Cuscuta europaea TaxID=41803 RepID=A0A9P1EH10_CUSEU|nr:unnamed protein product [Cuscuta europaea]